MLTQPRILSHLLSGSRSGAADRGTGNADCTKTGSVHAGGCSHLAMLSVQYFPCSVAPLQVVRCFNRKEGEGV